MYCNQDLGQWGQIATAGASIFSKVFGGGKKQKSTAFQQPLWWLAAGAPGYDRAKMMDLAVNSCDSYPPSGRAASYGQSLCDIAKQDPGHPEYSCQDPKNYSSEYVRYFCTNYYSPPEGPAPVQTGGEQIQIFKVPGTGGIQSTQVAEEQYRRLRSLPQPDYTPWLIGGGIALAGIVLIQAVKR